MSKRKRESLINLVNIPKIFDDCYLCFAQTPDHVNFPIRRVFYILNRFTKMPRGYHAHKKTEQILFCIQGSIKVILDDGKRREEVILNRPEVGVVIENGIWHEMHNFKKNTILLVLASEIYDPNDYIRNYNEYLVFIKK